MLAPDRREEKGFKASNLTIRYWLFNDELKTQLLFIFYSSICF